MVKTNFLSRAAEKEGEVPASFCIILHLGEEFSAVILPRDQKQLEAERFILAYSL